MNLYETEFQQLAQQGYNRIPLVREILADLETPLTVYLKLANKPYSYLFESVLGGERWGRYSYIGLASEDIIRVSGNSICHQVHGSETNLKSDDPLAWVSDYLAQFKVPELEGLPRFNGGLVGYFGYDCVRYIEPRLCHGPTRDSLNTPDILLMLSDEIVALDNLSGKLDVFY